MNQVTKQELDLHNLNPVIAKNSVAEPLVVHSRDAATAAAAARVVARYAQLPSYSSLKPDWRTSIPDSRAKNHQPIMRTSVLANPIQNPALKSPARADVKPLAWFTKVEETKVVRRSARHKGSNQSVSPNSIEEAGVQMNADVIEAAGNVREWTSPRLNQFPLRFDDNSAELRKTLAVTEDSGIQLNIFEVDPGSLMSETIPSDLQSVEQPLFMQLDFESQLKFELQLDVEPQPAFEPQLTSTISPSINSSVTDWTELDSQIQPAVLEIQKSPTAAIPQSTTPQSAPWSRRTMAGLVDFSLILICFAALTFAAARFFPGAATAHPSLKLGVLAFFTIATLYQAFFLLLFRETPGARFAELSMSSFGSTKPTERQMGLRLLLLPVSILPAGLGLLWALFDPYSLCLHDRLSRTCLRYQY